MAWIEFHAAKIKRLQKFRDFRISLGWSVNEALGFLGNFWGEVIELRESGDIQGWKADYIVELTGVKTLPEKLWEALVNHMWIELRDDGRILVHDWLDCAGTFLRKKYSGKNRVRLDEIWALHDLSYGGDEDEKSTEKINDKCTWSKFGRKSTEPNLTKPNLTKQRISEPAARPRGDPGNKPDDSEVPIPAIPGSKLTPEIAKDWTPIQRIVTMYKLGKGIAWDDKQWDKANFRRYSKAAKSLLEAFRAHEKQAAAWLDRLAEDWNAKNLTWTLETAARHAWDSRAKIDQEEINNGPHGKPVGPDRVLGAGRPPEIARAGDLASQALRDLQGKGGLTP